MLFLKAATTAALLVLAHLFALTVALNAALPSSELIALGGGVVGGLYRPAVQSHKASLALFLMHAGSDYLRFTACTELASRGFTIFCANNYASKAGQNSDLDFDLMMQNVGLGMSYLRNQTDIDHVVLLGHSGCGAMMAAYQNIAENGVSVCNGPEKIYPCSDGLAGLMPADGIVLLDANYGTSTMTLLSVNPAIIDETTAFAEAFHSGVAARWQRLVKYAEERRAIIMAGNGTFSDDEPFYIPDAHFVGGNNKLFAQDTQFLSHTVHEWPLLHKNGSTTTQVVRSVRVPANLRSLADSFQQGALKTTINRFLRTFAIRVTDDFSYNGDSFTGIDWASSHLATQNPVSGIHVPMLTMGMTGHWEYLAAEKASHSNSTVFQDCSDDKTIAFVEGASHTIDVCKDCESFPGQYGDTIKTCFDFLYFHDIATCPNDESLTTSATKLTLLENVFRPGQRTCGRRSRVPSPPAQTQRIPSPQFPRQPQHPPRPKFLPQVQLPNPFSQRRTPPYIPRHLIHMGREPRNRNHSTRRQGSDSPRERGAGAQRRDFAHGAVFIGQLDLFAVNRCRAAFETVEMLAGDCIDKVSDESELHLPAWAWKDKFPYWSEDPPLRCDWRALGRLLGARWFAQLWIIQEVVVAGDVTMIWGGSSIPWETLAKAVRWTWHRTFTRYITEALEDENKKDVSMNLLFAREICRLRDTPSSQITLSQLLLCNCHLEASNPWDRVFGLLGLLDKASNSLGVVMDYERRLRDVYAEATCAAMVEQGSLYLLGLAIDNKSSLAMEDDWPSWVPRYQQLKGHREIASLSRTNGCRASDGVSMTCRYSSEGNVLDVKGVFVGRVVCVLDISSLGDMSEDDDSNEDSESADEEEDKPVYQRLVQAWLSGSSATTSASMTNIASSLHQRKDPSLKLWRKTLQIKDLASLFLNVVRQSPRTCEAETERLLSLVEGDEGDSWSIVCSLHNFVRALGLSSIVLSEDGRFGFCVGTAKVGDEICLLFGGDLLFVLRAGESERGCRKMGAYAVVPGVMEGEHIRQLRDQGRVEAETRTFHVI
ncbi:hypothetical protein M409DRAFT_58459 [Zasmidium cellare ATCC 36951]|uniref:Heterokaryon incompatibility domain-containing protein n=1 Tax=Zasmidium cellare ATCC 36951 TaxID=1080233 RepID=A0A6A6C5S7_ZASCE|nr:uncharacterized protein M409DRAFT_58459 [Zasmidium cellare ATCC 36951]KAF2162365.1 hypothetical protein M409DRAFT_58459 [Zasmidium cellare ATCC 36951]